MRIAEIAAHARRTTFVASIATAVLFVACAAQAGQTCEPAHPDATTVHKALALAQRARSALDGAVADVAIIARAGQDLSKYRLRWSHLGFVVREHPDGPWTVVHELNECATEMSALYAQGLGTFFMDDMFRYETLIVIPDADAQKRLRSMLSTDMPLRLHEPHYSVVAFPYATRYQNSNQWALELVAAAIADDGEVDDRAGAQRWLDAHGFRPSTLQIDAVERLGARLFRANVAFDDHPFDRRMAGLIDCVTVESVVRFVRQMQPGSRTITLRLAAEELR